MSGISKWRKTMDTEQMQGATNRKITWRRAKPGYNDFEPGLKHMQEDDWIMNVDGQDIAWLHLQSHGWWSCDVKGKYSWWPRGQGWLSADSLRREMEMAVEELLDNSREPPGHYYTGGDE
jgi:hypothetical protein